MALGLKTAVNGSNQTKPPTLDEATKQGKEDAAKKQRNAEKNKVKREKRALVADFVLEHAPKILNKPDQKKDLEALIAAAEMVKPGRTATGTGAVRGANATVQSIFNNMKIGDSVPEMKLFQEHRLGPSEMRKGIKHMIKDPKDPAERIWVSFDETSRAYKVVAKGAATPEGWTGYLPVSMEDETIV